MIIKSKELDEQLEKSLWQITPSKNFPLRIKGSYKFKPYGSYVTDIDYTADVKYNEKLLNIAIPNILNRIQQNNNFIFMDFSCGVYKDFILPWKIFGTGCEFDYDKTIEWYNNLKEKKILKPETENFIEDRLFKDSLSIKDLIEIRSELEPYFDIKWSMNDLYNGYVIDKYDKTTRYEFLDMIVKFLGVLKVLFVYYDIQNNSIDYIPLDVRFMDYEVGMSDFEVEQLAPLPHYTENWYKIFKLYKWYILPEYLDEYIKKVLEIDYQNALLNRLKILKKIKTNNLLAPKYLNDYLMIISKELNDYKSGITSEQLKNYSLPELISLINKNINKSLEKDVVYFKDKIIEDEKLKQNMYSTRVFLYSMNPTSITDIIKRTRKGIKCPFYDIDSIEYDFLFQRANDLLLDPIKFINCFISVSYEYELLIKDIINITSNKAILKISTTDPNVIELYKREFNKFFNRKKKKDVIKVTEHKLTEFNKDKLNLVQEYLIKNILNLKLYDTNEI